MVEISASSRLYFALLPEALSLPCGHAVPQSCPLCILGSSAASQVCKTEACCPTLFTSAKTKNQ